MKPRRLISASASGRRNMRGFGVAGLALRRDGADLDEAEAHRAQAVDAAAVLVEPGGQADAVREFQAGDADRVADARMRLQAQGRVLKRAIASSVSSWAASRVEAEQEGRVSA